MIYKFLLFTALITISTNSYAVKYRDMGITDDEIAASIKSPKPTSISQLITHIKTKHKTDDIDELDLGFNNICVKGAAKILEFANTLPKLKTLNLSNNRIYDWRGEEANDAFENQLVVLLNHPNFEDINLQLNGVANSGYIEHLKSKIGVEGISKIRWIKNSND
jgi:hypothetical protein